MNIREFSLNLQKVYAEMSETFGQYQSSTGLNCLSGCGRCCMNPDIEASPLEMIPLALKIYDEGKLDEWLQKLESPGRDFCLLLKESENEGQGQCISYNERPSICRMFGVGGVFDKHHKTTLSICKYIKEASKNFPETTDGAPLIPLWSSKLASLDPELTQKKYPINKAIKLALEKVAFYAQYQVI
jgi:Fe-S-cluster containining protein